MKQSLRSVATLYTALARRMLMGENLERLYASSSPEQARPDFLTSITTSTLRPSFITHPTTFDPCEQ